MRILLVDDLDESREIAEAALLSAGYSDVVLAKSGREALRLMDTWHPVDLVLLDIMMPTMDGIETCTHIRKNARHTNLPIIMLTTIDNMDAVADAFIAGATTTLRSRLRALSWSRA